MTGVYDIILATYDFSITWYELETVNQASWTSCHCRITRLCKNLVLSIILTYKTRFSSLGSIVRTERP